MCSEKENLIITADAECIDVLLTPSETPVAYERKLYELVNSGITEEEAKSYLLQPIQLELFYDYIRGLFAVESEAVDCSEIYNPYTGEEVPKTED